MHFSYTPYRHSAARLLFSSAKAIIPSLSVQLSGTALLKKDSNASVWTRVLSLWSWKCWGVGKGRSTCVSTSQIRCLCDVSQTLRHCIMHIGNGTFDDWLVYKTGSVFNVPIFGKKLSTYVPVYMVLFVALLAESLVILQVVVFKMISSSDYQ